MPKTSKTIKSTSTCDWCLATLDVLIHCGVELSVLHSETGSDNGNQLCITIHELLKDVAAPFNSSGFLIS